MILNIQSKFMTVAEKHLYGQDLWSVTKGQQALLYNEVEVVSFEKSVGVITNN